MTKRMLVFDYNPTEKSFFESENLKDFDISLFEGSLNSYTLKNVSVEDLKNTEIISVFFTSSIDNTVLDAFEKLKIIATRTNGCNHINLEECIEHDIAVVNVTDFGENAVAEYVMGMIIILERKILNAIRDVKRMKNIFENYVGKDFNSLTLGVIGTGDTGEKVCKSARKFDMNVIAYDPKPDIKLEEDFGVKYTDLITLLKHSDIVSIHASYNDETYHLISKRELDLMKQDAYLINTSRGEIVDTYALYKAIKTESIAGCVLDVSECEDFCFDMETFVEKIHETSRNCLARSLVIQKMLEMPNVIITPHIAYRTHSAINEILTTTIASIRAFYKNKKINRVV